MTNLRDRYSYWNRLVPLLLSGLFDELPDVQRETRRLWREIGAQYAKENRDEIREKYGTGEDEATMIGTHLGEGARPSLGCRVLVQRIFFNVLPLVINDLKDWQENIRIQSLRLLHQMLLHAERHAVILLDKIFSALSQVTHFLMTGRGY